MANDVTIIFPHQLFQNHPALQKGRKVYLVEEWLFFRQYNFHKQKLVLHRASMKFYENWLQQNKYSVHYIETAARENDCRKLVASLAKQKITSIHLAALADDWLLKRMQLACTSYNIALQIYDSPNFLNTLQSMDGYFNKKRSYFQTDFYTWQRKQRNILLDTNKNPLGGKWTFDADNRQRFPKKEKAPLLELPEENNYVG